MEKRVIELYSKDDIAIIDRKRKGWIAAAIAAAILTLAGCIFFCLRTNTLNAQTMLLYCIICSVLGGWVIISIVRFPIQDLKNAKKHTIAILNGTREEVRGRFTLTDERIRIINGIAMYKVKAEDAGRESSLQLFEGKKKQFSGVETDCVYSVHGFVAAYEADNESN